MEATLTLDSAPRHAKAMHAQPLWSPCGEAPAPSPRAHTQTVIALHASGSSARQWRALAARLQPPPGERTFADPARPWRVAEWQVHVLDLHDHGSGPAWTRDGQARPALTLDDDAALVEPLLLAADRVADGGGVHLVGHSYGGAVALKLACDHPQHVRSLVLYEPVALRLLLDDPASQAEAGEILAVVGEMRRHLAHGHAERAAQHFVNYWSGVDAWPAMSAAARGGITGQVPILLQQFGALLGGHRQAAALARLEVPVQLLSGQHTVATARRIAQQLCALQPRVRHETLPGLGHMGPLTHPDRVADRIAAHLRALPPTTAAPRRPPLRVPVLRPRDFSTVD